MHIRLVLVFLFINSITFAQSEKRISRKEYIDLYKKLAMDEMKRTGIPASITLAQGCLESGDGNSRLAKKANNHFGIKCHDWNGQSIREDDDSKNECFRKYKSAEESYRDHSDFLTTKSRYSVLFELKPDDYKGWAKGLKKTGYATSPTYSDALIKLVEDFELYTYDQQVLSNSKVSNHAATIERNEFTPGNRKVLYNNRVKYIIADSNDTYSKLADEMGLFSWQLPRYNEVNSSTRLKKGESVYIQPKRNQNLSGPKTHIVKAGETLHSISQLYGVKELKLRERNKIPEGSEPNAGATIMLRGRLQDGANIPVSAVKAKTPANTEYDDESEFQIEIDLED